MAKKNHTLGKLFALTTTAAAISGVCYIFRDQIKQSSIYKKSTECFSKLFEKVSDKFCQDEDDFFFDDDEDDADTFDDIFSEDNKKSREYTSITINQNEEKDSEDSTASEGQETSINIPANEEEEALADISADEEETTTDTLTGNKEEEAIVASETEKKEDMKEIFSDDSIPTIDFGNNFNISTSPEENNVVSGYENEGLSDVSEDPDVLEEQDKLDY